jgi:hypothetical protein
MKFSDLFDYFCATYYPFEFVDILEGECEGFIGNATEQVKDLFNSYDPFSTNVIIASNELFGDSFFGKVKTLSVSLKKREIQIL